MANIIKKKIVQELAKFTKNLTSEKLKLSSLKGEGELSSLELDEDFLTCVLQLPPWLRISKVVCAGLKIKIHWTKLKTEPVSIVMNDVDVELETCDDYKPRVAPALSAGGEHEYGLSDKVIDGITLTVNNVSIDFRSPGFQSNLLISDVKMVSVDGQWQPSRLENTRFLDKSHTKVTHRKLISWETLRIQAQASQGDGSSNRQITPILLISNHSSLRLLLTKRVSDCEIVAARLELFLDSFLWVLTASQLRSVSIFARTFSLLIQHVNKLKRAYLSEHRDGRRQAATESDEAESLSHGIQVSHHIRLELLELQLCDGQDPASSGNSQSMQVMLRGLRLDFYPNRPAWGQQQERAMRNDYTAKCQAWITTLLQRYSWKERLEQQGVHDFTRKNMVIWHKFLRESWLVASLLDIQIRCVALDKCKELPPALFQSSKKELHVPDFQPACQIEYTSYFYEPDQKDFFTPWPHLFAWVNPIQVLFHEDTLLWLLKLTSGMAQDVADFISTLPPELFEEADQESEKDVRVELIMPKFTLPLSGRPVLLENVVDAPHALQLQAAQLALTNCGSQGTRSTQTQLGIVTQRFQAMPFFLPNSRFPYCDGDLSCLPSYTVRSVGQSSTDPNLAALGQVRNEANPFFDKPDNNSDEQADACLHFPGRRLAEVWMISADQCWLDFVYNVPADAQQLQPNLVQFLGSIPIEIWLCRLVPLDGNDCAARVHMLIETHDEAHLLLERAEFLWLLSLRDQADSLYAAIMTMLFPNASQPSDRRARGGSIGSDSDDTGSVSTFRPSDADSSETLIALSLHSGMRVSLLLPEADKPIPRQQSENSLLGIGSRLLHIPRDSPEFSFSNFNPQDFTTSFSPSNIPPGIGFRSGDTTSVASYGSLLESDNSSMVDTESGLSSAESTTGIHGGGMSRSPFANSSVSLNTNSVTEEKVSDAEKALTASAAHSCHTDDSGVNADGSDMTTAGMLDKRCTSTISASESVESTSSLATLLHFTVSSVLCDVQTTANTTRIISKAQNPHLEAEPIRSALALRNVVYKGVGKRAVPDVKSSEVLARMSMGESVASEATNIGLVDPNSMPELFVGLLQAEARDVHINLSEKYFGPLGDFFRMPKSGGVLPLDVRATNCRVEIEALPDESTLVASSNAEGAPVSTVIHVGRVRVSCNPNGEYILGLADTPAMPTSSDGSVDVEAHASQAVEVRRVELENSRLREQLVHCRQTMEQACGEREALLQTILRLQDEITNSNIMQDELHAELFRLREKLRTGR